MQREIRRPSLTINFFLIITLGFTGCASTASSQGTSEKNEPKSVAANAETTAFLDIEGSYRQKAHDDVLKRSRVFFQHYSKSQYLDQVYNYRALSYVAQKQYQFAALNFKKGLESALELLGKKHERVAMFHYNLAFVNFELNQLDQSWQSLQEVDLDLIRLENRPKYFILQSKIARARQNNLLAAQSALAGIAALSPADRDNSTFVAPFAALFVSALDALNDVSKVETLYSEFSESPLADYLLFKIGQSYFNAGERNRSKKYFETIVSKFAGGKFYVHADDYLRRLNSQESVQAQRIGVMLTLSGKFARFGYNALQGIQLATKIFQPPGVSKDNSQITLVVMDDQGDIDRGLAILEEMFYKHQVIAVIGPMVSKLAEPIGKRAQELGLPLIALTQKEASGGDYVFNAALTPAMQVHQLFAYAREKVGAKRFAVMAPATKFGEEYVRSFWDEVQQNGLVVRGFETYNADETDFRAYVDRLVGLAHGDARIREVAELETLKAASPIKTKSTKKLNQMFSLKPIIDFDAVFIPDEPKVLGQVLPTFAYRDVEKVLFLGINTWNSPELISRAGPYVEGSVFVDGYYAESTSPSSQRFTEEYRSVYGSDPGLLEVMSYDAARIVWAMIAQGRASTRSDLRNQISTLKNFPGVTGKISYESGRLTKRLNLLTVKGGKIVEIAF